MKRILFLIYIIPLTVFSQQQTKSLLWEIKSPYSEKISYLYGTMHISGRLAFHLGEEFFDAIQSTDAIALESNPIIWLDEIFNSPYASDYLGKYGFRYQTYKGFYQEAFKLSLPDNKSLGNAISKDHYLSNWMLYRENKSQLDFEEETFLDLFIYQTGMKNNKSVYSLENFMQTTHLNKLGNLPDQKKKEKAAWYEKLTEEKTTKTLIEEAYRNKDVMLLDSIHGQINSDHFIKYMLDVRNDIMAIKIDSFIQKADISLFIGIGAAHLGGEYGVIKYLRDKGYSVNPVSTSITKKAKTTKTEFDKKTTEIQYNETYSSDMFSVSLPSPMYETPSNADNQRQFFSPELTNGSYFSVKQISTYSYFSSLKQSDYLPKVDSILFENIPGNTISKQAIKKQEHEGLDILNQTANGNYQRYQIFITPLNILIFKMGGKNEFVKKQSDGFFNSIQLKDVRKTEWTNITSNKQDFSIDVPAYHHIKNNDKITSLYGHPELEAYDPTSKSYYFLKRSSIHDFTFIEQDNYELKRLIEKFFESLDIDSSNSTIVSNLNMPMATGTAISPKQEQIEVKVIINGAYYYLLAGVSAEGKPNDDFFSSFKIGTFKYNWPKENKIDSTLLFSVKSSYLYPTIYDDLYEKAYNIKEDNEKRKKEDNSFKSDSKSRVYYSENFERVYVEAYKYHNFSEYTNIDSLWKAETRYISKRNGLVIRQKSQSKIDDLHILNVEFSDTASSRVILVKEILNHGYLYTIKTTTDTSGKRSEFITNFFDSFTPLDTMIGESIFEDKSKKFLQDIYSEDSLTKAHALESIKTHVNFDNADFEPLKQVILNYPFNDEQIEIKRQMIADLGKIKHKNTTEFLMSLYSTYEDTAMYQMAILNALARQHTKYSYQKFLDLLDQDIPLSGNSWGIQQIYRPFYDSLELAIEIYPDLLNYTFIPQYKTPTYSLLATLVSENVIKPKHYKKSYKQILREAKIELKSQISQEQSARAQKPSRYSYSSYKNQGNWQLVNYAVMLMPFHDKSAVQIFFEKLNKVQDYTVQTSVNIEKVKAGIPVGDSIWLHLAEDLINRSFLYESLTEIERTDLFPSKYGKQQMIVESLLYQEDFNPEKDSMMFIRREEIQIQETTGYVYFFKSKGEYDDDWVIDYVGLQPKNSTEININPDFLDKGVTIEKYKKIEEIIEEEIETIKLEGHKRAKKTSKARSYDWYY